MAAFIGSNKKDKIRLGSFLVRIPSGLRLDGILLKSLDDLKLKDIDNKQLTAQGDK